MIENYRENLRAWSFFSIITLCLIQKYKITRDTGVKTTQTIDMFDLSLEFSLHVIIPRWQNHTSHRRESYWQNSCVIFLQHSHLMFNPRVQNHTWDRCENYTDNWHIKMFILFSFYCYLFFMLCLYSDFSISVYSFIVCVIVWMI